MAEQKKSAGKETQAKPIEQNLWVLDDDDDHVEIPKTSAPKLGDDISAENTEEVPADISTNDNSDLLSKESQDAENDFEDEEIEELSDTEEPSPQDPLSPEDDFKIDNINDLDESDNLDESDKFDDNDNLDLAISSESPDKITAAPTDKTSPRKLGTALLSRLSTVEKASLGLFGILLLGFFIWLAASFTPPNDWISQKAPPVSFPVKGKTVTIDEVNTAWREPVRSGKSRDTGIRLDTRLIPLADVTIGGGSGQLRIIFQNGEGEIIGDTITKTISNGQFDGQNKTTEIHGTDGFEDSSLFNNYAQEEIRRWTLSIYEVNDQQADSEPLLTMPIAAALKKN